MSVVMLLINPVLPIVIRAESARFALKLNGLRVPDTEKLNAAAAAWAPAKRSSDASAFILIVEAS